MKKYLLLFLFLFITPILGWSPFHKTTQPDKIISVKKDAETKHASTKKVKRPSIHDNHSGKKLIKQSIPYTAEQKAAVAYDLAMQALRNGDKAAASISLHKVIDQIPNHTNARLQLIDYYRGIGEVNKVEELLQQGLGINSKEPLYIKQMALLLNNKAEYGKALTLLLTMPKTNQDDVEYKQLLALTYFHEGFFDLAQKHYIQLLRIEPSNSNWRLGLAIAQDAAGEHQKALENFARARHYGGLDSETIKYIQQRMNNLQQGLADPPRSS
jgi:tetratricopeptide (TPR) repeat protein